MIVTASAPTQQEDKSIFGIKIDPATEIVVLVFLCPDEIKNPLFWPEKSMPSMIGGTREPANITVENDDEIKLDVMIYPLSDGFMRQLFHLTLKQIPYFQVSVNGEQNASRDNLYSIEIPKNETFIRINKQKDLPPTWTYTDGTPNLFMLAKNY